jgi:hypothetical protein
MKTRWGRYDQCYEREAAYGCESGAETRVPEPAAISPARRAEVIDALRRGTVPQAGLDLFAVGMERFERAIDEELDSATSGRAVFKAVRGE